MDNETLINLVEGYEELYNPGHRLYNNQLRRDTIWKEIGETMNENDKSCKERWNKIRDNHRKALQLRKAKSAQSGITMKPPKYNKELQFLLPYIQDDESTDTDPLLQEQSMTSHVSDIPSPVASYHPQSPEPESWTSRTQNQRFKSGNPENSATVQRKYLDLTDRVPNTVTSCYSDEHDPLIGFFINMGKTVKGFPLQEQIRIKSEIFTIVNNAEMDLAMQSEDQKFHVE